MKDKKDPEKRLEDMCSDQVQTGNRAWWTSNAMAYDWHGTIDSERYTREWFDQIDQRFLHGARLFASSQKPFDQIMPLEELKGKRVLEIGCGMGFHCETMVRAGADVTAVDVSPKSIEATSRRLALKGLNARVIEADAENLAFDDHEFDFVWSWGVIHHSARTARIVREIARVVRPEGQARVMVYNRLGMAARLVFWKSHIANFRFLTRSYEESLYRSTDGFSARYYIPEQFEDLFRAFFADVRSEICGQDADVIPLPRQLRRIALTFASENYLRRAQAKRGAFIFLTAKNLLPSGR